MTTYRSAGVDIDAGERAVELMKAAVQSTYGPEVLAGIGAFGGLYDAVALRRFDDTILVASTDGVGTKTILASQLGRFDTIGQDIVNHCVNDILVQGARPLLFMDYIASARLHAEQVAAVVQGIAGACRAVGAALLGGETAEMPGVYAEGAFDLVGTIVGVVRRSQLIDGSRIQPGDAIVGLLSNGLHTNGYSLARQVFAGWDWLGTPPGLDVPLGEALLAPHTCYLPAFEALRRAGIDIKGMAHITGGGIPGNLPRILPADVAASIAWGAWPAPAIFGLIRRAGGIDAGEMFRVFNMGLGMLVVMPASHVAAALAAAGLAAAGPAAAGPAAAGPAAFHVGAIMPWEPGGERVRIV